MMAKPEIQKHMKEVRVGITTDEYVKEIKQILSHTW